MKRHLKLLDRVTSISVDKIKNATADKLTINGTITEMKI